MEKPIVHYLSSIANLAVCVAKTLLLGAGTTHSMSHLYRQNPVVEFGVIDPDRPSSRATDPGAVKREYRTADARALESRPFVVVFQLDASVCAEERCDLEFVFFNSSDDQPFRNTGIKDFHGPADIAQRGLGCEFHSKYVAVQRD